MKRWHLIVIVSVIVAVSIGLMNAGNLLKRPLGERDQVLQDVQQLEVQVKNKDWQSARQTSEIARQAWDRVVNRIQFSVERELIVDVSGSLARMEGAARAEDEETIMEEIYYFYDLWDHLGT